ncbi:diguanylate cyclase domain-containing protein [Herminiimonas arsenitoxidans]|uniref:diguanylate cyclase domain-containing protein n=1 Tax=Herminiimonas arsenitoxidans TaxID=1809410 RepID=UPI0009702494|nr:diguanylate cyclase [Herminiimonas arsenitoxidans]
MRPKTPDRLRLATLVTIGVCATVIVTMLALLVLVDHFAATYAKQQAQERLQQLSWQMRDSLDRGIARVVDHTQVIANLATVRDSDNAADIQRVFDNIHRNFSNYAWIGLTDTKGMVIAASDGLLDGVDVSQRPWFMGGQKQLFIGDYHPSTLLENKLPNTDERWRFVDVALPITHSNGMYRGVLGIHLSWDWARSIANELLVPTDRQYMVEVIVVRNDGMVILGPDYLEESTINTRSVALSRTGRTGAIAEKWPDGQRYLTGYSQTGGRAAYSSLKWSVLIRQPEEIALAAFRDLQKQILLVGGLVGLLLALVAVGLARGLAKPLDDLSAAIVRRRDDDFEQIPIIPNYHEVHLLSVTLADMVERERQHVKRLHTLNENLEHLVQERTREIEKKAGALEEALAQQLIIQERLRDSEAELRATLQNANDAFIAMDQNGIIVDWNEQAEHLLGWTRREAIGQNLSEMVVPPAMREDYAQDLQHFIATGESNIINQRIEVTALRRDGVEFPIELAVACVPRRDGYLFIAFLHDITERKLLQASLMGMALKDALTDLPNRRALMQKLPESIARAARLGKPLAVLFLDLDGFKGINDGYGHEAGDELLRTIGQRLSGAVRTTDTVARLAGDEFVIVLEMINGDADAIEVADKILQTLQQPFTLTAATVSISASIGIAMHWPEDSTTAEQLITLADGAMYVAKKNGKNRAVAV